MTKEAKVRDKNLGTHGDTTGSQPMGSWSSEVHEITVWGVKLNTPTNHCLEKKKKAKTKTKNKKKKINTKKKKKNKTKRKEKRNIK